MTAPNARRPAKAVQPKTFADACGARSASVRASTWDEAARTIEFVALANESVDRRLYDGTPFREVLPMAVGRFDRLSGRANLFISDNDYGMHVRAATKAIGVLEGHRVESGGLIVIARLSDAPGDADHTHKVATGILPSVSLDYTVDGWIESRADDGCAVVTATGWEAVGLNVVGVPADAGAHSRAIGARSMDSNAKMIMGAIVAQAGDGTALEKVYKTVGKAADLDPAAVGAIAKGEQEATPEELAALAKALGLTFAVTLIDGEPVTEPDPAEPVPAPAGENAMTTTVAPERALADERKRSAEILSLAVKHGRSADAPKWLADGATVDAVRTSILDGLVATDTDTGTRSHVQIVSDAADGRKAQFINAIEHRERGVALIPGANRFCGRSLVEAARRYLVDGGFRDADNLSTFEIAQITLGGRASMVSTDLPQLLANVGNKSLILGMADVTPVYTKIAQRVNTSSFHPLTAVLASSFPLLLKVPEGGDYQPGNITDSSNPFTPARYGRKIKYSVEMLTKDDLGGLTRVPQTYGALVQNNRDNIAINVLTTNAALASDSIALFNSAGHGNIATGAVVDPPSVDSFGGMRGLLAVQQNADGLVMGLQPTLVFVPFALLDKAQSIVAGNFMPTSPSGAPLPWMRNIEVIAHGALDTADAAAWYMFADPNRSPVLQWTEVDGHGPMLDSRYDWDNDCLEFKVVDSFGVGAVDYRGAAYNAGT